MAINLIMDMLWICKSFDELSVSELYALLQLRAEIFVVEQNCVYQDMDGKDRKSFHLLGFEKNMLTAYTRLVPPGISYAQPSIGRVVVKQTVRKNGIGKKLMEKSIQRCYELFGKQPIKIGAQLYLKKFYESLGFVESSDVYDEDGITHIEMVKL